MAKVAGGAKMFDFPIESDDTSIGHQNAVMAKLVLQQLRIPLVAEDTGKDYGRTIVFDPSNNELEIKAVGHPGLII